MYIIRNNITQQPLYPLLKGKIERAYAIKVVADQQADKVEKTHSSLRVDVVEISRSARLWLENQNRVECLYRIDSEISSEGSAS